ncbi:MAG: hypothetical protein ACRDL8_11400, partial [Solirubrobacteraceae bacterium]
GTALPAGPYVQVAVQLPQTALGTVGSLAGNFAFQEQTQNGTPVYVAAMSGVSAWLGSNTTATFTGGQGVLVITSGGIAGYVSGYGNVGAPGVTAAGQLTLQIDTMTAAVDQTITLGGQQLTVDYGTQTSTLFSLGVSNLSLTIDNLVTVEGAITYTSSNGYSVFAGNGLTIFFGNGPAQLANGDPNPLATGLEITGATVALLKDVSGNYALDASGTVQLVGVSGVSASGTIRVQINTFTRTGAFASGINETIALSGSGSSLPLVFSSDQMAASATAPFSSVSGLGLSFNMLGQSLTGDVTVTDSSGAIAISIANAQISLSDGNGNVSSRGPPFAQLTKGTGTLQLSSSGVAGTFTGTVAVTLPGASLTGTFGLQINTTSAAVATPTLLAGPYIQFSVTGGNLTIGSATLAGDFTLTQSTAGGSTTTTLTVSH